MTNDPNSSNTDNPSDLPEGLQLALEHFGQLCKIQDPIRREYELLQAAKLCDLPLESFRQMFKDYCRQQQEKQWRRHPLSSLLWRIELTLEWLNRALSQMDLFQILEYFSKLSILIGLIVFMIETPKRAEQRAAEQKRTNYESWRIIRENEGKAASGGRIDALQDLNESHIPLSNINLAGAFLSDIKLPWVRLDGANLSNTRLNQANLQEAILTKSNLHKAWLQEANLKNAKLFGANLTDALLSEANLSEAVLTNAKLMGANLQKATLDKVDLEGAIYNNKTRFPQSFNPSQHSAILLQPGAKLQGKDFSYYDLTDLDFSEVDLKKANLSHANLQRANLSKADLEDANLEDANLDKTNLRGVMGLTITQVQKAKNWKSAHYDLSFREKLGLSPIE
jgi:BTB/POZ domain-containing protein KCTD9